LKSIPALVTPFTKDGAVDYKAFCELLEWHLEEGSDAILIQGTTGESPTLDQEEFICLVKTAKDVLKNQIPLVVGTGTNSTKTTIEKTKLAKELGADFALVIVPYYNIPSDEGCLQHFKSVAKEADLPMIAYYHPGRTGKLLQVNTLVSILEIPNIIALKDAASLDSIRLLLEKKPDANIYAGIDTITVEALNLGAVGSISVLANAFPFLWKKMVVDSSEKIQKNFENIFEAVFKEINPVGIKELLSVMQKCLPVVRLPLVEMKMENKKIVKEAYEKTMLTELVF